MNTMLATMYRDDTKQWVTSSQVGERNKAVSRSSQNMGSEKMGLHRVLGDHRGGHFVLCLEELSEQIKWWKLGDRKGAHCYFMLDIVDSRTSQLTENGNICVYICSCIYIYLQYF